MDISGRLDHALSLLTPVPSKAELARSARLSPVTVRAYFKAERNPPLDVCEKLGKALSVRGRWLFDGSGSMLDAQQAPAQKRDDTGIVHVPLIDEVTAGRLTAPTSQIPVESVPLLAFADLGPGDFFATRVAGTSMDRISPDGSIIVVNKRDRVLLSGKCYLFASFGETTYKRWQGAAPAYLEPFSTDPIHKPIFVKRKRDFEVIGRVKRTVLDL